MAPCFAPSDGEAGAGTFYCQMLPGKATAAGCSSERTTAFAARAADNSRQGFPFLQREEERRAELPEAPMQREIIGKAAAFKPATWRSGCELIYCTSLS